MLSIKCPSCNKSFRVSEEHLGSKARCRKCGHTFTLEMSTDETGQPRASSLAPFVNSSGVTPGQRIGRYVVNKKLGAGGMGEVWLAHDPDLRRDVAIKVLRAATSEDEQRLKRFIREAQSAACLHHANTVVIYDIGTEGDLAFIAMEYVDGGSLDTSLSANGKMDWRAATQVIRDAAAGLGAAHKIGLVHRDVKPANLMRTAEGETKVADFGLARSEFAGTQLTQQGTLMGTPAYMSPEQWMGQEVDGRSDLYSLICTYYHLVSGQVPFEAPSIPSLGYQHRYEPFPDPRLVVPNVPDGVCRILSKGSAKEPENRFQTADELIGELDALLAAPAESHTSDFSWKPSVAPPDVQRPRTELEDQPAKSPAAPTIVPAPTIIPAPIIPKPPMIKPSRKPVFNSAGELLARALPWFRTPAGLVALIAPVLTGAVLSIAFYVTTIETMPTPRTTYLIINSIGMKLKRIPTGEFTMGSKLTAEEVHRRFPGGGVSYYEDEHPWHRVRITKPFYLGVHEVTVGDFRRFVAAMGYRTTAESEGKAWGYDQGEWTEVTALTWKHPGFPQTDEHPVTCVSWTDAEAFCRWLSQQEGCTYRLPTEAEWEYACRAGTDTVFFWGDEASKGEGYLNAADLTGPPGGGSWSSKFEFRDGHATTASVGSFKANAWGLYDMHGNVWEWCQDWAAGDYYINSPADDPTGPATGSLRVDRGRQLAHQPGGLPVGVPWRVHAGQRGRRSGLPRGPSSGGVSKQESGGRSGVGTWPAEQGRAERELKNDVLTPRKTL